MLTDQKLPGYRFPLSVIGHGVWFYHRYALSYRDVEELLFEHGIEVSRESIRTWCINFSSEFAQHLRHRELRRGSRWHLDEMHVVVGGVTHWLWRAVGEHGIVLDVFRVIAIEATTRGWPVTVEPARTAREDFQYVSLRYTPTGQAVSTG